MHKLSLATSGTDMDRPLLFERSTFSSPSSSPLPRPKSASPSSNLKGEQLQEDTHDLSEKLNQERVTRARRRIMQAMRLAKEDLLRSVSDGSTAEPLPMPTQRDDSLFPEVKSVDNMPLLFKGAPMIDFVPSEREMLAARPDRLELAARLTTLALQRKQHRNTYLGVRPRSTMPRVVYDSQQESPYDPPVPHLGPDTWYYPWGDDDTTLCFESRFESGNLRKAVQVEGGFEYDLLISPDINTVRHAQWFYFGVRNTRPDQKYTFNIMRLPKKGSLFNEGMQPVVFSVRNAQENGVGWVRQGVDIAYFKTSQKHHTLSFTLTFEHANDQVYIAYCYPVLQWCYSVHWLKYPQDKFSRTNSFDASVNACISTYAQTYMRIPTYPQTNIHTHTHTQTHAHTHSTRSPTCNCI
jgi:hypothetical protein